MNRVILVGNLTKDPELRVTQQTGTPVCTFTVAVRRTFAREGDQQADFISVVTWRKQAENCSKYLRKGSQVAVSGSIQSRSYDAQDGTKRYVTEVVADEVQFLNRVGGTEGAAPQTTHNDDSFAHESDMTAVEDDLPF